MRGRDQFAAALLRAGGEQFERASVVRVAPAWAGGGSVWSSLALCAAAPALPTRAIPEALRQASARRSSGLSTSVPLPRGHASSRNHALVDGTFRVSVREPEREIVRWGPGRAWCAFLANRSIAATGRAAPGRRPPHISSDGRQTRRQTAGGDWSRPGSSPVEASAARAGDRSPPPRETRTAARS
jgi:hypothetical protein